MMKIVILIDLSLWPLKEVNSSRLMDIVLTKPFLNNTSQTQRFCIVQPFRKQKQEQRQAFAQTKLVLICELQNCFNNLKT